MSLFKRVSLVSLFCSLVALPICFAEWTPEMVSNFSGSGEWTPEMDALYRICENNALAPTAAERAVLRQQKAVMVAKTTPEQSEFAFWKKTYGARGRDNLFLVPNRRRMLDPRGFTAHLLFNMSNELPIAPNMVYDISSVEILGQLAGADGSSDPTTDDAGEFERLMETLPYIRRMIAEERRIGLLLSAGCRWNKKFLFQADIPLLFMERNYWLRSKEDMAGLKAILEKLQDVSKKSALLKKTGFGDLRLKGGYQVIKHSRMNSVLGLEAIVPVSKLFYDKPRREFLVKSKPGDDVKTLLTDLLNVGQRIMLEPKLGVGHWGLGAFWEIECTALKNKLDWWARLSFDYLFSDDDHRFFPPTATISLEDFFGLVDKTIPDDFPLDDLFPILGEVRLSPGHILNITTGLDWHINKRWTFSAGYDLYYQEAERISNIRIDDIDASIVDLSSVHSSGFCQHKVFYGLEYLKKGKRRDWTFGFGGDFAFSACGGGKDWTVFGKFGITF